MTTALITSQIALWVLVLALAAMNLLLLRQVGVLFERVAPAGALATGNVLKKGMELPGRMEPSLTGGEAMIGSSRSGQRGQLLFFAAPDCPVCKSILPAFRSLAASEAATTDFFIASAGEEEVEHKRFIERERLQAFPYVLSDRLGMELGVSKLPYAVLLDSEGRVEAFGLVNSREHLESLFEARDQGVISLQEYLNKEERA